MAVREWYIADKAYTGILSNDGGRLAVTDATCVSPIFWMLRQNGREGQTSQNRHLNGGPIFPGKRAQLRAERRAWKILQACRSRPSKAVLLKKYTVDVAIGGDGGGRVTIKPGNIVCKVSCTNEFCGGNDGRALGVARRGH